MKNLSFLAADLGNSWYKILAADDGIITEHQLPNAIALFEEEFYELPYDEEEVDLEENLIVEVKSKAIVDKRERYYIGKGALRQRNVSGTSFNNQKVQEDRTFILLFGIAAYHALLENPGNREIQYDIQQLAVSLPTTQYKENKEFFKNQLIGTHSVIFHKVPGISDLKEIYVQIHIHDVIVGAEGACAYIGMTRD